MTRNKGSQQTAVGRPASHAMLPRTDVPFVVIVCFLFSLLNHFYVLDAIYFRATGKHNPAWFKPAPSADTNGR